MHKSWNILKFKSLYLVNLSIAKKKEKLITV